MELDLLETSYVTDWPVTGKPDGPVPYVVVWTDSLYVCVTVPLEVNAPVMWCRLGHVCYVVITDY